jgi:hypothetical protein
VATTQCGEMADAQVLGCWFGRCVTCDKGEHRFSSGALADKTVTNSIWLRQGSIPETHTPEMQSAIIETGG